MKRLCFSLVLAAVLLLPSACYSQLIAVNIVSTVLKKVIRQIDLKVQKIQNKTIALQNAQKAMENSLVKSQLNDISQWMEKQRKLYENYYSELRNVKSAISTGHTVQKIIAHHAAIVCESKAATAIFGREPLFSGSEISHIRAIHRGIFRTSEQAISELKIIISPFETQMTDSRRLELISSIARRMQKTHNDLRRFNTQNHILRLQRIKLRSETEHLRRLHNNQIIQP